MIAPCACHCRWVWSRVVCPGLYGVAACENDKCEAYQETVVCNFGMGTFSIGKLQFQGKCPACHSRLPKMTQWEANNCKIRIEAFTTDGDEVVRTVFVGDHPFVLAGGPNEARKTYSSLELKVEAWNEK